MVAAAIGASAVAGLAGSALQAGSAGKAGAEAAAAQRYAADLQMAQYQQTRGDLQPFFTNAQNQLPALTALAGQTQTALTGAYNNAQAHIPGQMTQASLEATPGYQFNLSQGLKAVQNSAAARGLGVSGTALKGAAQFGTGLADSTYQNQFANQQQQFNDYNQQFSNVYNGANAVYNQTYGPVALGESAAAQSGAIGQAGATQAGNNIAGAGQSLAAADLRQGSAYAQGANTIGSAYGNYLGANAYQNALKGTSVGAETGTWDA